MTEVKGEENALRQEHLKRGDDGLDQIRHVVERFEQRLRLDDPRLAERYVKGELHVLVRFSIGGIDKEYVACFQRAKLVSRSNKKWDGGKVPIGEGTLHHLAHMRSEVHAAKSRAHGEQQTVLVHNVKLVDLPEKVIPSLVWFETVDGFDRVLRRSLYLPKFLGFVLFLRVEDGEVDTVGRLAACSNHDQLVCQVIEGGSQILDRIPDNRGQQGRNILDTDNIVDQLARLGIALGADYVGVMAEEAGPRSLKVLDVAFGPFDFGPSTNQPVREIPVRYDARAPRSPPPALSMRRRAAL